MHYAGYQLLLYYLTRPQDELKGNFCPLESFEAAGRTVMWWHSIE